MTFRFQPAAEIEFLEAIAWYEAQRSGLGKSFWEEVNQSLKIACSNPGRFRIVRGKIRTIRLKRFHAYAIYFAIKEETLSVIAVFHSARNPAILKKRLS